MTNEKGIQKGEMDNDILELLNEFSCVMKQFEHKDIPKGKKEKDKYVADLVLERSVNFIRLLITDGESVGFSAKTMLMLGMNTVVQLIKRFKLIQ